MKTFVVLFAVFAFVQTNTDCGRKVMEEANKQPVKVQPKKTVYDRLPPNISLDTEVRRDTLNDKGEVASFEVVTAEQRLSELKARYVKDILVDEKGREIKFFEPLCRGASAGFERDEIERKEKEKELAEWKKKNYTVIVVYCNPAKMY